MHFVWFGFFQRFPAFSSLSFARSCSDIVVHSETCLGNLRGAVANVKQQLQSYWKELSAHGQTHAHIFFH